MSTAAERIEVFQDTMNWINNDPVLSASIPIAKSNTTVFYEDDYPAFNASNTKQMTIAVSGDRSYQAAMKLHKENPDAKIAVMNFANAFHAGGGVTKGSSAQEESLCRTSTLYPLMTFSKSEAGCLHIGHMKSSGSSSPSYSKPHITQRQIVFPSTTFFSGFGLILF